MYHDNFILKTDSYKLSHWKQYPKGTSKVFSFFESRGGMFDQVVFFGLQYLLQEHLAGQVVTEEDIREAAEVARLHFGNDALFNEAGWRYILKQHGGRLPLEIRAVPEGVVTFTSNALITVENTDENVPWLTNYIETLLVQTWYPCTIATQSREMKKIILRHLEETGTPGDINFKLHDFGFRGSTTFESAEIGGAAHLVNFQGTDTLAAIMLLRRHYDEPMAGFSVPATEHSTITSWGRQGEYDAFANALEAYPNGIVSVVSDSYDIYHACRELWGSRLKEKVLERNGVLVVRPDSGDPIKVVVAVLDILGDAFGYVRNKKGFKVLNPKVRVIQGDGITYSSLGGILEAMKDNRWSADNIVFGSGGGLLQKVDRDTQKFAFKCSATERDGKWHDVMKDPVTDSAKRSKAGRLALIMQDHGYKTVRYTGKEENLLVPVFRNGEVLVRHTFADIRKRAEIR